jgi:hypothetical protein
VEVEKKGHSHNDKGGVEQCFANGLTFGGNRRHFYGVDVDQGAEGNCVKKIGRVPRHELWSRSWECGDWVETKVQRSAGDRVKSYIGVFVASRCVADILND